MLVDIHVILPSVFHLKLLLWAGPTVTMKVHYSDRAGAVNGVAIPVWLSPTLRGEYANQNRYSLHLHGESFANYPEDFV